MENELGPAALTFLRVVGDCMDPTVRAGAVVWMDRRPARVGDLVVVRWGAELVLKQLAEWHGRRWLVALRGFPPVAVELPLEILGVAAVVVQPD